MSERYRHQMRQNLGMVPKGEMPGPTIRKFETRSAAAKHYMQALDDGYEARLEEDGLGVNYGTALEDDNAEALKKIFTQEQDGMGAPAMANFTGREGAHPEQHDQMVPMDEEEAADSAILEILGMIKERMGQCSDSEKKMYKKMYEYMWEGRKKIMKELTKPDNQMMQGMPQQQQPPMPQ